MKTALIGFTGRGIETAIKLQRQFAKSGGDSLVFAPKRLAEPLFGGYGVIAVRTSLNDWAGEMFGQKRALIFVGAAGIAVRAIAPWVKDKMSDSPVVVVDEACQFAIPLLSGHVGGANELAEQIAQWTGAVPVITTATDVNGLFAVDVFAVKNKLAITDRSMAKEISAGLLAGEMVGFLDDFKGRAAWTGLEADGLPKGCVSRECEKNIWITVCTGKPDEAELWPDDAGKKPGASFLRLVPKAVVLGAGCKKDTDPELFSRRIKELLREAHIDLRSVKAVGTIDLKKEEPAVLAFCREIGAPLRIYSAGQLSEVPGTFAESEFVRRQTGVGNVCERAACAGGGTLILQKQPGEGITLAAALEFS